jgi:FdrA protein
MSEQRSSELVQLHRGRYHDSIALMRASAAGAAVKGVDVVIAAMATELNVALIREQRFDLGEVGVDDLVVAVRAETDTALAEALTAVEATLSRRDSVPTGDEAPAHTVEGAAGRAPDAPVVLVSVPGPHAFVEAMAALESGRHVMVFSDGVPVEQEVRLKAEATERQLLVMGPDCGTAVLDGVGLGFANVVEPGPVGIVAASGTGAQQLCCLLDAAGVGVRHVIGVGGRDLSAPVGGTSTLAALALLDADPRVEVIAVVSKPPAPEVSERLAAAAERCTTPVVVAAIGPGAPTITDAAGSLASMLDRPFHVPSPRQPASPTEWHRGRLVGLFSGGTNAAEALVILEPLVGPVRSNIHYDPARRVGGLEPVDGHVVVDLGDDELTAGRPHPMIDARLAVDRLIHEIERLGTAVVLLDVVLGHGAADDPAGALAPLIRNTTARNIAVVATLIGAAADPQGLEQQAVTLLGAGAVVHRSVAAAARQAAAVAIGSPSEASA